MPKKSKKSVSLQGKVLSFNISPKGDIEGVLVSRHPGSDAVVLQASKVERIDTRRTASVQS